MARISSPVFVLLLFSAVILVIALYRDKVVRKKRGWILPPKLLAENEDHTIKKSIAKIPSDVKNADHIEYYLEGIGASEDPVNVFIVDRETGEIRVTRVLDREEIDMYNLLGTAKYIINGLELENKTNIRIKVGDENDNSPTFPKDIEHGFVYELSPIGTSVMTVTATDIDEPGHINSQIAYSIIKESPPHGMFGISKHGTIYVRSSALDRETQDEYTLELKGVDLDGDPRGNTGTGTVVVHIYDANANPPHSGKGQGGGAGGGGGGGGPGTAGGQGAPGGPGAAG